nr:PREDICTED: uncharacterized protein LOC109042967 [Bemisia tabaci]
MLHSLRKSQYSVRVLTEASIQSFSSQKLQRSHSQLFKMLLSFSLLVLVSDYAFGFFFPFPLKIPIPFKVPVPVPAEKERFFLPPPWYYYPRVIPTGQCITDLKQEGTCMTKASCNVQGGVVGGSCTGGVCCVFERTCGGSSKADVTYFKSPSYPGPFNSGLQCSLTVSKASDKICQVITKKYHIYFQCQ